MSNLEDDLALDNWLSVVSFDLHKYIKAGGLVAVSDAENGLIVQFVGVFIDDNRLHRKFKNTVQANEEQHENHN